MKIIIFGPPGAGKGTQGNILSKSLNIPHISTGDILRSEISSGSALGLKAKAIIDGGNFLDDPTMNQIVASKLKEIGSGGVIIDGYPRTIDQAIFLDALINSHPDLEIDLFLEIDVNRESLFDRIQARAANAIRADLNPRPDDTPDILKHRLEIYEETVAPVVNHYRIRDNFIRIDGNQIISKVSTDILSKIEEYFRAGPSSAI